MSSRLGFLLTWGVGVSTLGDLGFPTCVAARQVARGFLISSQANLMRNRVFRSTMYCRRCLGPLKGVPDRARGEFATTWLCGPCGLAPASCTCEVPMCAKCGKHRASVFWLGNQGLMEYTHGGHAEFWCECCAVKAQLKYARDQARRVRVLEKKLENVKCR